MGKVDKNKLRGGVSALFSNVAPREDASAGRVNLPKRGGRPDKGTVNRFSRKTDKVTSVAFDPEQHSYIRRLSLKTGITFKELMYRLIQNGIEHYENGELVLKAADDGEEDM